ncbi:hypothetical protein ACFZDI_18525 [Streptomyces sp. NPDC007907]|uniref:hypothetical protein n=1 Tax=Streptomyces sp. NPDC007907 TaxID=3364789 RepID=UPI0036E23BBB
MPGASEWADTFGGAISVGDVDADGYTDVSTGSTSEGIGEVYAADQVTVLRGGRSGLTGKGASSLNQNTGNVPGTAEQIRRRHQAARRQRRRQERAVRRRRRREPGRRILGVAQPR